MMMSWWWMWLIFLFVFLLPPIGYGWGYRRWGPPYPRYIQRRRGARAAARGDSSSFDHHAWGWGGDVFWMILCVWIFWFLLASSLR